VAYTAAQFIRREQNADRSSTLVFRYTGNAGEPIIDVPYPIDTTVMPTANSMRALAMARITKMNNDINFAAGADPTIGQFLDVTTPLPPPPPSTFGAFCAASAPFTPGPTPQDVFTITGSSTRQVVVTKLSLTTVQTTAGMNAWAVVKRATANVGGTAASVTAVPLDDAYPAATATVLLYTANPTAGALIGNLWSGRVAAPAAASAIAGEFEKSVLNGGMSQPVRLTGPTDVLAWNFGGAAVPAGLSVQACLWWTES
jgi:hypothetical protein